jgi:hypothetical protein
VTRLTSGNGPGMDRVGVSGRIPRSFNQLEGIVTISRAVILLIALGSARSTAVALAADNSESYLSCPSSTRNILEWKQDRGPDFWVCRAAVPNHPTSQIVAYYGYAADFKLSPPELREQGRIEGMPIEWQASTTESGQLRRDAIFVLKPSRLGAAMQVHVWIVGDNTSEIDAAKNIVRSLSF